MLGFLLINIYALLLIISTTIIFFSKNRLHQVEDETYKNFLIVNLFMSISGIVLGLVVSPDIVFEKRVIVLFNKVYLICLILWIFILTFYTIYVSMKNKDKITKYKKIFSILELVSVLLIILLPIDVITTGTSAVSNGPSIMFTYAMFALGFIIQIMCVIKNYKDFRNKKYIPLYVLIFLGTIVVIALILNPSLNYIINPSFIFITFIMYHTIENPDTKILKEIHNAKEISDNANEEKTMFLYNMTNEIRQVIKDIEYSTDNIINAVNNKTDANRVLLNAREIKNNINKFTMMTNEILDISQVDINNIKIYKNKYNVKIIIKELVQIYKSKCLSKGIEFRSNIASDVPTYLYGDSVSLKKVLTSILHNSLKYTNFGYIEFNIDSIIKNDVCRLVISIEDSGKGMRANELSKIFNSKNVEEDKYNLDSNLYNTKKLITLMGGTIIANSVYLQGTKMKVVLDQKIAREDSKLDKYEKVLDKKKILLVDDSDASAKIISKMLSDTNVILDIVTTGKEALDKIRNKDKYDLILLDEEMQPLDGITVMKKLKDIRNFNIKVILLTRNNNYEYNDEYLKYGFSNYLLKPIEKDKLFELINDKKK